MGKVTDQLTRLLQHKVPAIVHVHQDQGTLGVHLLQLNTRLTRPGQAAEELLFDGLPIPVRDLPAPTFWIITVDEKLVLQGEFLIHELVDEGSIVVDLT
jgi:hypothetical protein